MSRVNKVISLPSEAVQIYKRISSKKVISIEELTEISNLDRGKVEYLVGLLSSSKLIKKDIQIKEKPVLTQAGKLAVKNQLVERRIIQELKKKQPIHLTKLADKTECDKQELNAGIGLLKKHDLIQIDKGNVSLKDISSDISSDLQSFLEKINQNNFEGFEEYKEILLQRSLITIREIKKVILQPIKPYEDMKDLIKEEEDIRRVTPEMLRNGSWRDIKLKEYDLEVSPPAFHTGRKQPYARFLDEVKRKLTAFGFMEMRGPLVELEFWNFDALFQAQDHPAREWSDVYRVAKPKEGKLPKEEYVELVKKVHENGYDTGSKGWRYRWDPKKSARLVLRAQGTSVSARTLVNLPIPSKYFSISRCFRPDTVDATHLSEFNQVEGIVADPSITFRDLLGILKTFAEDVAEASEFRFVPDYYPFTEPSVELNSKDPNLGRIEFGGAGIFRPEVTRPFGIDVPVIAWGLGIDRLFMVKYGITDIRELFSQKLEWLRSAKMS